MAPSPVELPGSAPLARAGGRGARVCGTLCVATAFSPTAAALPLRSWPAEPSSRGPGQLRAARRGMRGSHERAHAVQSSFSTRRRSASSLAVCPTWQRSRSRCRAGPPRTAHAAAGRCNTGRERGRAGTAEAPGPARRAPPARCSSSPRRTTIRTSAIFSAGGRGPRRRRGAPRAAGPERHRLVRLLHDREAAGLFTRRGRSSVVETPDRMTPTTRVPKRGRGAEERVEAGRKPFSRGPVPCGRAFDDHVEVGRRDEDLAAPEPLALARNPDRQRPVSTPENVGQGTRPRPRVWTTIRSRRPGRAGKPPRGDSSAHRDSRPSRRSPQRRASAASAWR